MISSTWSKEPTVKLYQEKPDLNIWYMKYQEKQDINLLWGELDYGWQNFDKDKGLAPAHVLVEDVSEVLKLRVLF